MLRPPRRHAARAASLLVVAALTALFAAPGPAASQPAAGPWASVAAKLSIPVFRPTVAPGLKVGFVNVITADPGCINDGREQLRAFYSSKRAGRYVEIFEGRPRYCHDVGVNAPVIGRPRVGGKRAQLYDLCGRRSCDGTAGAFAVEWCARGTTITIVAIDFRSADLLKIARGMRPVDKARALACRPPAAG